MQAADGVILLGQGVHQDAVRCFDKLGLPMVVWGAQSASDATWWSAATTASAASLVARALSVASGRRRPVFIGNPSHPEIFERLIGFVDALAVTGSSRC